MRASLPDVAGYVPAQLFETLVYLESLPADFRPDRGAVQGIAGSGVQLFQPTVFISTVAPALRNGYKAEFANATLEGGYWGGIECFIDSHFLSFVEVVGVGVSRPQLQN
jgi:hypothetical protein